MRCCRIDTSQQVLQLFLSPCDAHLISSSEIQFDQRLKSTVGRGERNTVRNGYAQLIGLCVNNTTKMFSHRGKEKSPNGDK